MKKLLLLFLITLSGLGLTATVKASPTSSPGMYIYYDTQDEYYEKVKSALFNYPDSVELTLDFNDFKTTVADYSADRLQYDSFGLRAVGGKMITVHDSYGEELDEVIAVDFPDPENVSTYKLTFADGSIKTFLDYEMELQDTFWIQFKPIEEALRPSISGSDSVLNNIDNPYTLEQIKKIANIKAIDPYYGDLTDSVTVSDNQYLGNENKVGTFPITFSVTNPYGLTATTVLNIINRDISKPNLVGPSSTTVSYKTTITSEEVIAKYTVTDNYDQDLIIQLDSTNYQAGKVGTYTFNLKATDKSGNIGTATHTVIVKDDVKPTITDEHVDPIEVSFRQELKQADLLIGLTANDEIDGVITNKIIIKSSNFQSGKIGTYVVVYEVKDAAGNIATHQRDYKVITTENPIFYVSKNLLLIEDINQMTIDQIIEEIARYENLNIESYKIINDSYTSNSTKTGTYELSVSATLTNGEIISLSRNIRVFNLDAERPDYREPNFFEKVWNFLYQNILKHIVNFFIWILNIFNHIIRFFGVKWELLNYLV